MLTHIFRLHPQSISLNGLSNLLLSCEFLDPQKLQAKKKKNLKLLCANES